MNDALGQSKPSSCRTKKVTEEEIREAFALERSKAKMANKDLSIDYLESLMRGLRG